MTREELLQEITDKSKRKLAQYYPAGVPKAAQERLNRETEVFLKHTGVETLHRLLVFNRLSELAEQENEYVLPAGTAVNSIFVFLLGHHRPNPLPPHYYCVKCGHCEAGNTLFADDLPEKRCPACGHTLRADGYSLPEEFAWGTEKELNFELHIASGFYSTANETIREYYAQLDRMVVTGWYDMGGHSADRTSARGGGAIVLEPHKTPNDYALGKYPEMIRAYELGLERLPLIDTRSLNLLRERLTASGEPLARVPCAVPDRAQIGKLLELGLWNPDETLRASAENALTYRKLIDCCLAFCDTVLGENMQPIPFEENFGVLKEYGIFCREDVFEAMLCAGADREEAFRVAEIFRKGQFRRRLGEEPKLPERLKKAGPCIGYLFPRGHAVENRNAVLRLAHFL